MTPINNWQTKTLVWVLVSMFGISGALIGVVYGNMQDTVGKKATKDELYALKERVDAKDAAMDDKLDNIQSEIRLLIRMHLNLTPEEKRALTEQYRKERNEYR